MFSFDSLLIFSLKYSLFQIKVPKITTFDIPIQAYFMFLYTTFQTYLYVFGGTPLPYARLANLLISLFGTTPISILFWTVVILHILESLYTIRLCRSHSTGFTVGVSKLLLLCRNQIHSYNAVVRLTATICRSHLTLRLPYMDRSEEEDSTSSYRFCNENSMTNSMHLLG